MWARVPDAKYYMKTIVILCIVTIIAAVSTTLRHDFCVYFLLNLDR
jgi:hypothetical protein